MAVRHLSKRNGNSGGIGRTALRLLCLGVIVIVCACATEGARRGGKQSDAKKPVKGKWISMFNGKDLKGWKVKIKGYELGDNYADTFRVEDGLLKVCYDKYEKFMPTLSASRTGCSRSAMTNTRSSTANSATSSTRTSFPAIACASNTDSQASRRLAGLDGPFATAAPCCTASHPRAWGRIRIFPSLSRGRCSAEAARANVRR